MEHDSAPGRPSDQPPDGAPRSAVDALVAQPGGPWTWTRRPAAVHWSARARALLGLEDGASLAALADAVAADDRSALEACLREAEASGQSFELPVTIPAPKGPARRVLVTMHFEPGADPDAPGLGVIRDVTELDRRDATLAHTLQELETAQAVGRIGSWSLDVNTGEVTWSKEMRRQMRSTPEAHGAPERFADVVHPEDRLEVEAGFERGFANHEDATTEYRIVRSDGEVRWIRTTAHWLRDDSGAPTRLVGTNQDITEARAAAQAHAALKAKVERAQRLDSLEQMAAGIAHDFNNLLVAVLGNANLVLEDLPAHSPNRELVQEIEHAAQAAADLAGQMLAYSGHSRMTTELLDLGALVRELTSLMQAAMARQVVLTVDAGHGPLPVQGDRSQLRQVLLNLVTNASEAFGEGSGRVWVRAGARRLGAAELAALDLGEDVTPGDYITLEVEDDGPGIPPSAMGRLFDPFFTTKFMGRGLGLAVVLGMVRGHDGAVAASSAPGERTRFTVYLPAARRLEALPPRRESPTRWAGEGTVLVADDDPNVLTVARRMLERIGFVVVTAEDGTRAHELLERHRSRLKAAVLDLTMPGLDGVALLEAARDLVPDAIVLISSGYSHYDMEKRMGAARPDGFLQKPYTLPGIRTALREATEARRRSSS